MIANIQYVIDNSGNKTSVILPFSEWKKLNANYQKLKNKLDILQGIQDSMEEIKDAKRKGNKLQTLTDFLDENRT